MRRSIAAHATVILLILMLVGCGSSISTRSLGFTVAPDANDHAPVPVELVVVYDGTLVPQLLELSAREWFDGRQQLLRDHPRGVRTYLWELVPGQNFPMQALPLDRSGAAAAFVYADYRSPGAHRIRIDSYSKVRLQLTADEVLVEGS